MDGVVVTSALRLVAPYRLADTQYAIEDAKFSRDSLTDPSHVASAASQSGRNLAWSEVAQTQEQNVALTRTQTISVCSRLALTKLATHQVGIGNACGSLARGGEVVGGRGISTPTGGCGDEDPCHDMGC